MVRWGETPKADDFAFYAQYLTLRPPRLIRIRAYYGQDAAFQLFQRLLGWRTRR